MTRIFLFIALMASLVGLSGCDRQPQKPEQSFSTLKQADAYGSFFLAAIKRGDQAGAEKFMTPNFIDDSRDQFAEMSAILKKSPSLELAIFQPKPGIFGPDKNEFILIYTARDGEKWVSAEVRVYRPEKGAYEVEYWDVKVGPTPPKEVTDSQELKNFILWFMGGMAALALLGLAVLIWVIKRKTHIIAPEPVFEERRVAATTRDFPE